MFLGSPETVNYVENLLRPIEGWYRAAPIIVATPSDLTVNIDPAIFSALDEKAKAKFMAEKEKELRNYMGFYAGQYAKPIELDLLRDEKLDLICRAEPFAHWAKLPESPASRAQAGFAYRAKPVKRRTKFLAPPASRAEAGFVYITDERQETGKQNLADLSHLNINDISCDGWRADVGRHITAAHEFWHMLRRDRLFPAREKQWLQIFADAEDFNSTDCHPAVLHNEILGDWASLNLANASERECQLVADARILSLVQPSAEKDRSVHATGLVLPYLLAGMEIPDLHLVQEASRFLRASVRQIVATNDYAARPLKRENMRLSAEEIVHALPLLLDDSYKMVSEPVFGEWVKSAFVLATNRLCPRLMQDCLGDQRMYIVDKAQDFPMPRIPAAPAIYQIANEVKNIFGPEAPAGRKNSYSEIRCAA